MTGPAASPARVAVIGDVGGHLVDLRRELVRLGADADSGQLPDDLTVVQVGDLIHRGPDSAGVVALADHYLTTQPGQWVQLVGNHEAQYLRSPAFDWPERLADDAVTTLRRWWADGQMRVAAAIRTGTEDFLVTHAGLTRGFWRDVVDRLTPAVGVAAALNSLIGSHEDVLFHAGHVLGGGRADLRAGPIWAAAGSELIPSWLGSRLPFSQVHGHSTIADHSGGTAGTPEEVSRLTAFDPDARHETTVLPGGRIIGVDPGHGRSAHRPWRSWQTVVPAGSTALA